MPVTSFHVFTGARHSTLSMLKRFGMLRAGLQKMPGLLFGRAMGCGRGAAFSLWPDWQRYTVMMECASATAESLITDLPTFKRLAEASMEYQHWRLLPVRKHGTWDGQNPFAVAEDTDTGGRIAVLTRAAISLKRVPSFIRHSRQATDALNAASGLQFSIGMGEYPLVRQATFSIWEDDAAMKEYAYRDTQHIAAMGAKVKERMFAEEMFVRFRIAPVFT